MSFMEESCREHGESHLHDELEMNENQGNRIQASGIQVSQTSRVNEGGSLPKSQDPDLEDEDELSRLRALATDVREQVDLERDVGRQVCCTINFMHLA